MQSQLHACDANVRASRDSNPSVFLLLQPEHNNVDVSAAVIVVVIVVVTAAAAAAAVGGNKVGGDIMASPSHATTYEYAMSGEESVSLWLKQKIR